MNVKKNIVILIAPLVILMTGCKDLADLYLGIPLQPEIDKDTYVPGLNIFGVIRPDTFQGYNNSYIMLQKVIPAVGSKDSLETGPATVHVFHGNSLNDTCLCNFEMTSYNGVFTKNYYRPVCIFNPQAGDTFAVECIYQGLPVLTGTTIVPNKPVLLENTLVIKDNNLSFEIRKDSSIFMLEIYLYAHGNILRSTRIPAQQETNTLAEFNSLPVMPDSVVIYSYDYNFSVYYLTSNTSLNYNKYRQPFTTVQNGYGVFGSLNLAGYPIK